MADAYAPVRTRSPRARHHRRSRVRRPTPSALLRRISAELDVEKRRALIGELVGITRNDMVYLPLHQQPITWASKKGVDLKQGPDNQLRLRLVTTP